MFLPETRPAESGGDFGRGWGMAGSSVCAGKMGRPLETYTVGHATGGAQQSLQSLPLQITLQPQRYGYDDLGWCISCYLGMSGQGWMGNVFTAVEDETLRSVSFYTTAANARYTLAVYRLKDKAKAQ